VSTAHVDGSAPHREGWGPLRQCLSSSSSTGGALERMAPDDLTELCTGTLPWRDAIFKQAG
jgi:hypothetical protein